VLNHSGITRSLSLSVDQSGWTGPDVEPEKGQATRSLDHRKRLASQFEEMAEGFLFVDDLVQRLCGTQQSELDKANSTKRTRQSELDKANSTKRTRQSELDKANSTKRTRQSELGKANSRGGRLVGPIKFCHQLAGEKTLRRRNASAKISLCEEFA
jgi:hypothetical protein